LNALFLAVAIACSRLGEKAAGISSLDLGGLSGSAGGGVAFRPVAAASNAFVWCFGFLDSFFFFGAGGAFGFVFPSSAARRLADSALSLSFFVLFHHQISKEQLLSVLFQRLVLALYLLVRTILSAEI